MRRIRRVGKLEMFKINNSIVGTDEAQSGYVTPFATYYPTGYTSCPPTIGSLYVTYPSNLDATDQSATVGLEGEPTVWLVYGTGP